MILRSRSTSAEVSETNTFMAFRHPGSGSTTLRWFPHPAIHLSNRTPSNSAAFGSEIAPSAKARRHSRSNRRGFSPLPNRERFLTGWVTPTAALELVEQPPEEDLVEYAEILAAVSEGLHTYPEQLLELEEFVPSDRRAALADFRPLNGRFRA